MNEIVKTKKGPVQGVLHDGIYEFHGIPYAKPPVGPLRFRLPEEPEPWTEVYDASHRYPIAPQGPSDLDIPMGPVLQTRSEDCLTLSVSTPSLKEKLPVAVWLHGGANCYGGGDLEWYDGARLAKAGHLVVVNLNFRLGPLGFLYYPKVNEHNLCIEDQMLALRWVQDNIELFGGDPGKVTLFGQSAGANAIVHILSRPDSRDLFRQVILESPSLGRGNHLTEDAFEIGIHMVEALGISSKDAAEVCRRLQDCTADEILTAAEKISPALLSKHQGMIFKPVMDAWHTAGQTIQAAVQQAVQRKIRIMLGTTKEEMYAFITARDHASLKKAKEIQKLRYDLPAQAFARGASAGGCPVWKYRFDWKAPDSVFHSCHCLELPFVFGNLESWEAPMLKGASREELHRLKETIQTHWSLFFRFETPDERDWPFYEPQNAKLKCFDNIHNPVIEEPDDETPAPAERRDL